jgi:hypothetical protein
MITTSDTAQELHSRLNYQIHVRLMWRPHDNHLFVAVADRGQGEEFSVRVRDPARALDVFHHPFAYAALPGGRSEAPFTHRTVRRAA